MNIKIKGVVTVVDSYNPYFSHTEHTSQHGFHYSDNNFKVPSSPKNHPSDVTSYHSGQ